MRSKGCEEEEEEVVGRCGWVNIVTDEIEEEQEEEDECRCG